MKWHHTPIVRTAELGETDRIKCWGGCEETRTLIYFL